MQAIILAAGKGKRLKNLTLEKPKPLLPIKGVPMIGRTIKSLLKITEITEIIIITGHMSKQINEYVQNKFKNPKVKLVFNEKYHAGNVLTVCKAEPFIKDSFILLNADHLFSSKVYQKLINESRNITLGVFCNRKLLKDEMKIRLNPDASVEMSKTLETYDYKYTGITVVSKEHIKEYFKFAKYLLKSYGEDAVVEQLISLLSKEGIPVKISDLSNFNFFEVDTIDDYKKSEKQIELLEKEEMSSKINVILKNQYDLPAIKNIEKVGLGGYLNQNFTINTKEGKFFLQQTNKKLRKNVLAEIDLLKFLNGKKFPSTLLLKNKSHEYLTISGGDYYLISKFIEGHSPEKFNDLSDSQLIEAAKTLARYHKIIENYSAQKINNPNTASKEYAIKICSEVKEILKRKAKHDDFDAQIKEIIDKKLDLLYDLKLPDKLPKCPQLFCHGDYHGANLIFNPEDKIIGIVDWEFFGYDYRIWEVMRSMSFICDIDYTGSMVGPIDMKKAYKYLKTYTELYPLTENEFDVMIELIKYKSICSCFVIEQHYLKDNKETDIFLPKKKKKWFWWLEKGDLFKKKVIDKLI